MVMMTMAVDGSCGGDNFIDDGTVSESNERRTVVMAMTTTTMRIRRLDGAGCGGEAIEATTMTATTTAPRTTITTTTTTKLTAFRRRKLRWRDG